MKKIGGLLWEAYRSICMLGVTMAGLVLFFLWYPDFIGWFSGKLPNPGFLGIIPIVILVAGVSLGVGFGLLSISNWRGLRETTEIEA